MGKEGTIFIKPKTRKTKRHEYLGDSESSRPGERPRTAPEGPQFRASRNRKNEGRQHDRWGPEVASEYSQGQLGHRAKGLEGVSSPSVCRTEGVITRASSGDV